MEKFFTKTFFKFALGFVVILALSFGFIVATAAYQETTPAAVLKAFW